MYIIIAGDISDDIKSSLTSLGFTLVPTPKNSKVLNPLAFHPDMQVSFVGDTIVCEPELYEFYEEATANLNVRTVCGKSKTECNYPKDVAYNIKVIGNNVFHNFKYTDSVLSEHLAGYNLIDVSQGYSGCSICRAGENAIITSDRIIHKKALENNIDSLLISPGHIVLSGFDYGFIGGASFWHNGCLFFFGDVSKHPDYNKIQSFCHENSTEIIKLGSCGLTDYGSAFTFD